MIPQRISIKPPVSISVLRASKSLIESGERRFICCAVCQVLRNGSTVSSEQYRQIADECESFEQYMKERLNGHATYASWLYNVAGSDIISKEDVRRNRLAIIDDMITELLDITSDDHYLED